MIVYHYTVGNNLEGILRDSVINLQDELLESPVVSAARNERRRGAFCVRADYGIQ